MNSLQESYGHIDAKRRVICISHGSDVDGLASAAIIKNFTGAQIILADYGDLIEHLTQIETLDDLYICDLGLGGTLTDEFLCELTRIRKFSTITYIDHHPLLPSVKKKIVGLDIDLTHSVNECAAVLCYCKFADRLPEEMKLVAAYGAVTDYMDLQPIARKLIEGYDRHFVLLEATILSYATSRRGRDHVFMNKVVDDLSSLKLPHEMDEVPQHAMMQAERMAELMRNLKIEGRKMKNLAYIHTEQLATGNVAKFLIGVFQKPVGLAYKIMVHEDVVEASLRGSDECKHHLGKIASKLARKLGGSGGGHPKASGVRIPRKKLEDFLRYLDDDLC